jgi:hypothetical protein
MWKSESFVTDGATEKALKFLKSISQHKVRQTHPTFPFFKHYNVFDELNLNNA